MSLLDSLLSGETPEQRELAKRRIEVDDLQSAVAQKELDFVTLRAELNAFRVAYYRQVGALYRERDTLNANIALLLATLQTDNASLIDEAVQAAEKVQATEQELNEHENEQYAGETEIDFKPSAELKAAYRQAAKLMHPDRASNEQDKAYRNEMMAKVNVAYEELDIDSLTKHVLEFKAESEIGTGLGRELILIIRQEAKLRDRLAEIDSQIELLEKDSLMIMREQVFSAKDTGRDLLSELAKKLKDEIATLQAREFELKKMVDQAELERVTRIVNGLTPSVSDMQAATGSHIHRTERGDFVRSKSELVVSNVFHALGMEYRYEMQITGRNTGGTMLPDFVFITPKDELIVWEHLGMLDKPDYKKRWSVKLQWYEDNDFILGVNLFVSRDDSDGSLDSQAVRKQALFVKNLL